MQAPPDQPNEDPVAGAVADLLRAGRPVRLRLWGGSMRPLVRPGARLSLVPARPEGLRPGELAVACAGGRLTVHRVAGHDGAGRVLLLGDAARGRGQPPQPFAPEDVVGRVEGLPLGWRCWPMPRDVSVLVQRLLVDVLHVPVLATRWRSGWRGRRPARAPWPKLRQRLLTPRLRRLGRGDLHLLRRWALRRALPVACSSLDRLTSDLENPERALWAVVTRRGGMVWLAEQQGLHPGRASLLRADPMPWRLQGLGLPRMLLRSALTAAAAARASALHVHVPEPPDEEWRHALRSLRFDPLPRSWGLRWSRRLPP